VRRLGAWWRAGTASAFGVRRVSAVGVRHAGATTASRPSMSRVRRAVGRTAEARAECRAPERIDWEGRTLLDVSRYE